MKLQVAQAEGRASQASRLSGLQLAHVQKLGHERTGPGDGQTSKGADRL